MSAVLSLQFNELTVSFTLSVKPIQPQFKPNVKSAVDCSNIDEDFTSEDPVDSIVEGSKISQTVQSQFIDFSCTNPHSLAVSPHCATVS
jgi:serum/glucocorticoid-regulated kinase 2